MDRWTVDRALPRRHERSNTHMHALSHARARMHARSHAAAMAIDAASNPVHDARVSTGLGSAKAVGVTKVCVHTMWA